MSHSGAYTLAQNDDRYDKYFTAVELLKSRICKLKSVTIPEVNVSHTLFFHQSYKPFVPITSAYTSIKPSGGAGSLQFDLKTIGDYTSDVCLHVKFKAISDPTKLLRYCAFPGIRLLANVQLKSDGVVVDEYTPDDVIAYRRFFVNSDRAEAWDRAMGQQAPFMASYFNVDHTEFYNYCNGIQTPKSAQPEFELFIPLQFWFCSDPSQALLNSPDTTTMRTINIELASVKDMISAWVVDPENTKPNGLIPADLPITALNVETELLVHEMFLLPDLQNKLVANKLVSLIRVHKKQVIQTLNHSVDQVLLDKMKFPAEYVIVRAKSKALDADPDRWYMSGAAAPQQLFMVSGRYNTVQALNELVIGSTSTSEVVPLINTLSVKAKGVEIYNSFNADFYSTYLPIRYSSAAFVGGGVGYDKNIHLINFCLTPGEYQPSGYFNLATGHEMYIEYTLNDGANVADTELIISVSALNFLIHSGDIMRLKYSY